MRIAEKSYIFNLTTLGYSRMQNVVDDLVDDLYVHDVGDAVEFKCGNMNEVFMKKNVNRYQLFRVLSSYYVKAVQSQTNGDVEIIVYSNGGFKDEISQEIHTQY